MLKFFLFLLIYILLVKLILGFFEVGSRCDNFRYDEDDFN